MRTTLPALCLHLLSTAYGEPAHTLGFTLSPGQEAVIHVADRNGLAVSTVNASPPATPTAVR